MTRLEAAILALPTSPGEYRLERVLGVADHLVSWFCLVEIDWPGGDIQTEGSSAVQAVEAATGRVGALPGNRSAPGTRAE